MRDHFFKKEKEGITITINLSLAPLQFMCWITKEVLTFGYFRHSNRKKKEKKKFVEEII